jgi:hypothetical protein
VQKEIQKVCHEKLLRAARQKANRKSGGNMDRQANLEEKGRDQGNLRLQSELLNEEIEDEETDLKHFVG